MIIGIEATHANKNNKTGVENFCFEIIQSLKHIIPSNHKVILYSNEPLRGGLEITPPHWQVSILSWPFNKLWSQLRLSSEFLIRPPDVFFAPGQLLPLICPFRSVVMVHDSAFLVYPSAYHFLGRQYLRWMNTRIIRKAYKIITPSHFSKQELEKYYSIDSQRVAVVPEGYDKTTYFLKEDDADEITNLFRSLAISKPYILTVGRLEEKKNTARMIEVFNAIKRIIDCQLVLVGKPGVGYSVVREAIDHSPYKSDIKEAGYLSKENIATLLRKAEVFLFPSLYEGFGLPLLEAMASGCPVVTSSGNAVAEVGGGAALYANPLSVEDIAQKVLQLFEDKQVRKQQISQGLERVKNFSWIRAAEEIYQILVSSP